MQEIQQTIIGVMARFLPPDTSVQGNTKLSDLRISSIKTLQVITKLETIYDLEFEPEDLSAKNFVDIDSIAALVATKLVVAS